MWKWKINQDKLTIARGVCQDKETALTEMFRYADQYSEEDFSKMIITIQEKEK